jgi:ribosome-binding protein aMBF1 (putative translation factor)
VEKTVCISYTLLIEEEVSMDIAVRIHTERERLGLSQEKLTQRMGLDRHTL